MTGILQSIHVLDFLPAVCIVVTTILGFEVGMLKARDMVAKIVSVLIILALCTVVTYSCVRIGVTYVIQLYPLMVVMPLLILALGFHRVSGARFIFDFCYVNIFAQAVLVIPDLVSLVLPLTSMEYMFLAVGVSIVVVFLFYLIVREPFINLQDAVPSGWGPSCTLAVFGLAIFSLTFFLRSNVTTMTITIVNALNLVLMTAIILVLVRFFNAMRRSVAMEHDLELLRAQREGQERLEEERRQRAEEDRVRRHDQRHKIQVIIDQINNGDISEALKHLNDMRGGTIVTSDVRHCLNQAVNSVLKLWAMRSQDSGIDITIRADVPEELDIDPMELATLFANLMENAYEACMRLERNEAKRYIDMKSTYNNGKLACRIENSCRKDVQVVDGMPVTQKASGGGIGTHSARATVESHGGQIRFKAEDGVFVTQFMMAV